MFWQFFERNAASLLVEAIFLTLEIAIIAIAIPVVFAILARRRRKSALRVLSEAVQEDVILAGALVKQLRNLESDDTTGTTATKLMLAATSSSATQATISALGGSLHLKDLELFAEFLRLHNSMTRLAESFIFVLEDEPDDIAFHDAFEELIARYKTSVRQIGNLLEDKEGLNIEIAGLDG